MAGSEGVSERARRRPKAGFSIAAVVFAVMLSGVDTARSATLSPSASVAAAGASFSVSLLDTIVSADAIGAVDLEIDFNPAILAFTSASLGTLLSTTTFSGGSFKPDWTILFNVASPGKALISASETGTAGQDPSGTGTVVGLSFKVLASAAPGSSTVTVRNTPDSIGVASTYQLPTDPPIGFTLRVTPAVVPVPAPGLASLLLPALALLWTRRRVGRGPAAA